MDISRRELTVGLGALGVGAVLSACSGSPAPTATSSPLSATTTGAAASATTATSASATTTAVTAGRKVTVAMTGDMVWHDTLWATARADARAAGQTGRDDFDFVPQIAALEPVMSKVDLALMNSPLPIAPAGGPYSSYPIFSVPPQTITGIKAIGVDMVTTATNHTLDKGFRGLVRSLDAYEAAGILTVGSYRTEEESKKPAIFTTDSGVKIAIVNGTYGTNGIPLPEGKEWSVTLLDADLMLAQAKQAREAGADLVLANVHAGDEYSNQPNNQQTTIYDKLTASPDIDLVYGQHVHVVQPITKVNGKWVVYGLGNTIADHTTSNLRAHESIMTRFEFTQGGDGRWSISEAAFMPLLVTSYAPFRLINVNEAIANGRAPGATMERLQLAKRKITSTVYALGGTTGLVQL